MENPPYVDLATMQRMYNTGLNTKERIKLDLIDNIIAAYDVKILLKQYTITKTFERGWFGPSHNIYYLSVTQNIDFDDDGNASSADELRKGLIERFKPVYGDLLTNISVYISWKTVEGVARWYYGIDIVTSQKEIIKKDKK